MGGNTLTDVDFLLLLCQPGFSPVSSHNPKTGRFLWLKLPWPKHVPEVWVKGVCVTHMRVEMEIWMAQGQFFNPKEWYRHIYISKNNARGDLKPYLQWAFPELLNSWLSSHVPTFSHVNTLVVQKMDCTEVSYSPGPHCCLAKQINVRCKKSNDVMLNSHPRSCRPVNQPLHCSIPIECMIKQAPKFASSLRPLNTSWERGNRRCI